MAPPATVAVGAEELELPGAVNDYLKALLVHRAVVESAEEQIGELRLPAVRPMHDVMGVAVARVAAGELALVAIPALKGAAQRGRHRAGPAAHVEHVAVVGVTQHHQAGIAGDAARRLRCRRGCPRPAQLPPARRRGPVPGRLGRRRALPRQGEDRPRARSAPGPQRSPVPMPQVPGPRGPSRAFPRKCPPRRWRPRGSKGSPLPRARSPRPPAPALRAVLLRSYECAKRSPGLPGSSALASALSATSPSASARRCAMLASRNRCGCNEKCA